MRPPRHDLAIVIVSTNEAKWLEPCLSTVLAAAGDASLDVVVVDNESTDGTAELVAEKFPAARVVDSANHGFSHANNRGAATCDARYVLFLNPDTEIVDGTFGEMVAAMDARPEVGLVGVKQLTGDGELWPTVRYFPSVSRAVGEALASERWPRRGRWAGERELDLDLYEREIPCDWTSGSFMLCRREALLGSGLLDERFFIYSEETDLCLRVKQAGWEIRHLPTMTIVHHAGKGGVRPKMIAQDAWSRRQYAAKHFAQPTRTAYLGAVMARYAVRAVAPGSTDAAKARREASRVAMRTLVGRAEPPFGEPPAVTVAALEPT
jgi:N-acetylglucosaminyl-diphospho-decaprenol L-rhamnosyltransferase